MKKTGLILALTASALLLSSCASEQQANNATPVPVAPGYPVSATPDNTSGNNACKGMSSCKHKKSHVRHHRHTRKVVDDSTTTTAPATTDTDTSSNSNN